jgi:hypothetical protein
MMIEHMANQFIQQGNQNLLWKIINNTPQMIQFFTGAAPGDKERWFQQIIGHVYEDNARNSTNVSLRDLNKVAIDLMVDLLRKAQAQMQHQSQTQVQPQQQVLQPDPIENIQNTQIINKPSVSNSSSMESQFELRRKEYDNMTKKTVPTPAFKENVKDEAIGDIGSAVNEYMKQRDLDSKMFAPKEPLVAGDVLEIKKTPVARVQLDIEEIDNNFSAKKVKWGENTEHVYKENDKMHDVLEMIGTLTKKIDEQGALIKTLIEKLENNKKNIENN